MYNVVTCSHMYVAPWLSSRRALLWQFNVAGNNDLYPCLHATCLILTKFGVSRETYVSPQY